MRKLVPFALVLFLALCLACGDDNGTDNNGEPTVRSVSANTTVAAPPLISTDDAVWNQVTPTALTVAMNIGPPAKGAGFADSLWFQAIKTDSMLYVRVVWNDTSNTLWRDYWSLWDIVSFNWTQNLFGFDEDQLFVMFEGAPGGGWDTWNWRSLTTGQADRAEGMTYIGDTMRLDSGANQIAWENASVGSRPMFIHKDLAAFDGWVLYKEDRYSSDNWPEDRDNWDSLMTVPGWYIDTAITTWMDVHPESRWDITALYTHSAGKYAVVMARPLTSWWDDLDMSALDRVKMKIGVFENQVNFTTGGTGRAFTETFWLVL